MSSFESRRPRTVDVGADTANDADLTIRCDNLVKIYKVADLEVVALQGLDLHVEPAEMIALVGASGSGKSTLMNILGGLDVPSAGRAMVAGHDLTRMDGRARTRYRRRVVGFVWQQTERNLLSHLSASENVELPMLLDGIDARQRRQRASLLMDLVGVPTARRHGHPGELSGGEQQRVAVAIALANQPPVLLADEPTGELDGTTAAQLLTALRRVNAELRTTIVIVTHDPLVSDHVQRTIAIRDGRTSTETVHSGEAVWHGDRRAAAAAMAKGRGGRPDVRGVRRPRSGRPAAAAASPCRCARPASPGHAAPRGRPHRDLARPRPPGGATGAQARRTNARRRRTATRRPAA